MTTDLSNRAKRALEVLRNGGRFVETVECHKFSRHARRFARLYLGDACVRGLGMATFEELRPRLRLEARGDDDMSTTSWALDVWTLDTEAGR